MAEQITLDPITRIEGHLRVGLQIESQTVSSAQCSGTSFRAIETVMVGRDPRDACYVTQRICGVCPVPHATASATAFEHAASLTVLDQARVIRNVIQAANFIDSHLLSFFNLSLPDFIAGLPGAGNWPVGEAPKAWQGGESLDTERIAQDVVTAVQIRRACHSLGAIFGGRMPHPAGIVPGGATCRVAAGKLNTALSFAQQIQSFVNGAYAQTVQELMAAFPAYEDLGASSAAMLSFGGFPDQNGTPVLPAGFVAHGSSTVQAVDPVQISESVASSRYVQDTPKHPSAGQSTPDLDRDGVYSWVKAPRLNGSACEVGPLARAVVAGTATAKRGVWARQLARQQEAATLAGLLADWIGQIAADQSALSAYPAAPSSGQGYGLTEAPRGALGHWVTIESGVVSRYQVVSPTTWNGSPRDEADQPGPIEAALAGLAVADPTDPVEVNRVIHSFDPCVQCAVH